jgi:1,5-anhydro-D-fructose reductase (1,5-anhydro-D-mannitol-forming)
MAEQQVGWGFVGTSGWVASRFAPSVQAAGQRVVGGYGSGAAGSARFAEQFGATAYGSLEELLADEAVQAVWVASPSDLHPEHARAAVRAGKAVLVEKPLAVDPDEARSLERDLAAAPVPVGVGFQHRFNPAVAALAGALADGRVGTLSSLVLHHAFAGPARPSAWRNEPERGGGWSIADLGTHLMDIARLLLGEVEFWAARLSSPTRGLAVDDLSWVMLARQQATVVLRSCTGTPGPGSYLEASGSAGWVRVGDFWTGGGRLTDSTGRDEPIAAVDLYAAQVSHFSAAVAGGAWTGAGLRDGVRAVELMDAARRFSAERIAVS